MTTWLACNGWGGKSVYDNKRRQRHPTRPRPFVASLLARRRSDHVFDYEYPLVRYLEREGFDLSLRDRR